MGSVRSSLYHAVRIALLYLLFAGLWIIFSDRLLDYFVKDRELNLLLQTVKGWGFVLVTGSLLFIERKVNNDLFVRSETRFRLFLERSIEGLVLASSDGSVIVWNRSMEKITGLREHEVLGLTISDIFLDGESSVPVKIFPSGSALSESDEQSSVEGIRRFLLGGEPKEILTSFFKVPAGDDFFYGGIVRDVTEKNALERGIRKSLQEKDVLLKEVHHRVKNNLQLVISLLRIQEPEIHDEKALSIFRGSISRIRSISMIHENLYHQQDLSSITIGPYIRKMGADLESLYRMEGRNVSLVYDVDDTLLCKIDRAIPFGLLLNELLTNSFKYAQNTEPAVISISFGKKDGFFRFTLRDNGPGIPDGVDTSGEKSLGMNLITNLPSQIGGSFHLYNDRGSVFEMEFPEKDEV